MPLLRADDVVRRQRALWLGPPGHRWPFDATYVAWAVGFAVTVACVVPGTLFGVVLGGPSLWPLGPLVSGVLAWWVTRRILAGIDPDRPLRWWVRLLPAELRGREPGVAVVTTPVVVGPAVHRTLTVSVGRRWER